MLDAPQFTPPALTNKEMKEQEVALSDKKTPYVFSLKGQLLVRAVPTACSPRRTI